MAWAERLASGRYRGLYRDAAGRKRSVGETFTHKARAERAAAAEESKARRSIWADPDAGRRSWGEWVGEWWPTRMVEPSTLTVDLRRRRRHLDPRWASVPIGSIRRHDVRAWAAQLAASGIGPSTVQRCVHLLSASLAAAVDAEVIDANPAARLKLPQGEKAVERFLTRDEFDRLLEEFDTTNDQLIARMLAFTGLRWGELAGLHWNRVDLERRQLRVVEVYDEVSNQIKAYPKSKKARTVPLTDELVKLLSAQPTAETCAVEHRVGECRSGLVVTTELGFVLMNHNWSVRRWAPAVTRAGIGPTRIHDLRHTYASWLIQAGVPAAVVMQLLGHGSLQMLSRYAHVGQAPPEQILTALAPGLPHGRDEDEVSG